MTFLKLEIISGPAQERELALGPQDRLRVGRVHGVSDWAIPDKLLAPCHFALEHRDGQWMVFDATGALQKHPLCLHQCFTGALRNTPCHPALCTIYDLSANIGVYLNNAYVLEDDVLAHGDLIVAGGSAFLVHIGEAPFRARRAALREPVLSDTAVERILELLVDSDSFLYAIVDTARDPHLLELLRTHWDLHYSLYDGAAGEALDEAAPYLVALTPDSPLLRTLIHLYWGKSWGVLLQSRADFRTVRKQLRKFLMVSEESGRRLYFRFYDPRVLRTYALTCTRDEIVDFFGPIRNFILESATRDEMLVLSSAENGLHPQTVVLPVAPELVTSTPLGAALRQASAHERTWDENALIDPEAMANLAQEPTSDEMILEDPTEVTSRDEG